MNQWMPPDGQEPHHHATEHGSGPSGDIRAIQALWRAVLVQQVMDAKSRSSKPEAFYNRNQATHWLFEDQRDFRMVCDMADLDPDRVRHQLRHARERGFLTCHQLRRRAEVDPMDFIPPPVRRRVRPTRRRTGFAAWHSSRQLELML
jgi:hypothetical protein